MLVGALVAATASAACGHGASGAPVGARAGAATLTEPVDVLRALADAARRDDGAALDALIHPTYGLLLWDHPGASVSPLLTLRAGDGVAPSQRLVDSGLNDYWLESYWPHVAEGIDLGLTQLDREPADRLAPIYGDCSIDDNGGPSPRAWLVASDSFTEALRMDLEDAQRELDPRVQADLVHFRRWGLEVWMARDQGRLWVVHVMVSTPCDA